MDIIINYILFQKKKKKKKKKEKSNISKAEFLYSMVFWGIPSQSLKKKKKKSENNLAGKLEQNVQ